MMDEMMPTAATRMGSMNSSWSKFFESAKSAFRVIRPLSASRAPPVAARASVAMMEPT